MWFGSREDRPGAPLQSKNPSVLELSLMKQHHYSLVGTGIQGATSGRQVTQMFFLSNI